ncbi:MAG: hypothetical protein J0I77_22850 [Rudaea sp.]|uniref:RHS repeat domain-containing protein n=1 Tax=unclassified Rudaea TaxID=2627037 RepID=UPI0010F77365|nr:MULTISPECIES: RHS repeat-associated core domain-containing protein [unclassified Rudaea]MBN8888570.1 hypothetical protein [Rudaea sp.]
MSRSTNVLGQLMQTVDANGKTTNYWPDALGHVAAIRDVENNVIQATYNALGHRLQSVDPDQGTWNFTYNALGELQTQTDARNVTTTVTGRDVLGRVTQRKQISPTDKAWVAAENLLDTWTYDPANGVGQIATVSRRRGTENDPASSAEVWKEQYTYNDASRPTGIATTISEPGSTLSLFSTTTYDGAGRVDTRTYPQLPTSSMAGLSVKHTYTAYGQLGALSNAGTGYVYWVGQGQNAWGHVTVEQYPGVITGSHSDYLSTGQSKTLSWSGGTSDQVSYAYDGFGNLMRQQRSAGAATNTETYTYDSLQRLTKAARAIGDPVTYTYSANGNIVSKSDNGTTSYAYGGTSTGCGPHAVTSANGLSYTCDANGNVIGGAITAVYDADNHPRSIVRNPATGMMNWSYSTLGGMTTELSGQGLRYFGPNGYEQVGVGNGAKQVHELGPVVVTRTGGVDSVSVLLRDRLGSTISVVDNNVPTTRMYDAFGKARNGDMGNRENGTLDLDKTIHGFTKHDHADEVRLIHMGGRVYDYQLGRFLNVDPIIANPASSQSLNPYSYIGNNPLSGKDPTGYQCQMDKEGKVDSVCLASNDGVNQIVDSNGKKVATVVVTNNGSQTLNANQVRALNNIYGTLQAINQATNNAMGQVARLAEQFPKFMDSLTQGFLPESTAYRDGGRAPGTFGDDAFGFVTGANNTANRASNDFMRFAVWATSGGERHLLDDIVPISPVPPESRRGAAVGEGAMFMASLVGMPERVVAKGVGPLVGGGAKLENLTAQEIVRIQNAANRTGTEITVIGSRAKGTTHAMSDWDYVVPEATKGRTIHSLRSSLPEGPRGLGGPRNQDFFRGKVKQNEPFITFTPQQ